MLLKIQKWQLSKYNVWSYYSAPRYLKEFFSSLIAVLTSSNVNAETAQRACF